MERKRLNRILGGVVSADNEFPWHCALLKPDLSFYGCSAVLLSCDPVVIVTAAHCFHQSVIFSPLNLVKLSTWFVQGHQP